MVFYNERYVKGIFPDHAPYICPGNRLDCPLKREGKSRYYAKGLSIDQAHQLRVKPRMEKKQKPDNTKSPGFLFALCADLGLRFKCI